MAESSVQCQQTVPEVPGLKDQEITVGRHVVFECSGQWDKSFDFKKAEVKMPEENKYTLKVLKAEARSVSDFEVDVAFYMAGPYKFPDFVLTDGTSEIHLGEKNINVVSVIEQKEPQKPPQPFGAILPIQLKWPAYYMMIAVGIILAVVAIVLWVIRLRYRYSKLISKLKNYDSPISADRQFYKAIRQAEINNYPAKDVEHAFRLYVTRMYQIPAFDISDRGLISFFKRRSPWFRKERDELKKLLEDFKLIQVLPEEKQKPELLTLLQKIYRFVDHAEIAVPAAKKAGR